MLNIGNIVFQNPYFLILLLTFPFFWKYLRSSPLPPSLVKFPAIILVSNHKSIDNTPEKNSFFILLLRILIFIILVLVLSKPKFGKINHSKFEQLVIIDNSWTSSANWNDRKSKIKELLKSYKFSNFNFTIMSTTQHSKNDILNVTTNNYEEAKEFLHKLKPFPWEPNYELVKKNLKNKEKNFDSVFWFTESIINIEKKKLYEFLKQDNLFIVSSLNENLPPILKLNTQSNETYEFEITHLDEGISNGFIDAYDKNRRLLFRFKYNEKFEKDGEFFKTNVNLVLPVYLKNKVDFFQVNSIRTPSTVVYLNKWEKNKLVGLSTLNSNKNIQELDKGNYYVKKALEKNYKIVEDNLENLLAQNLKIIYIDDSYLIEKSLEKKLLTWLKNGGTLIKLSGKKLIRELNLGNENFFDFTFSLLKESSNLGKNLSLKNFLKIREFDNRSPFFGLVIPNEIKIKKYIQSNVKKSENIETLANLENGASLISAMNFGKGKMILFHVPCNLDWSNLCFSYLFVDLNERIINSIKGFKEENERILKPYLSINGFGELEKPYPESLNIIKNLVQKQVKVKYDKPPGLYKDSNGIYALNLSDSLDYNFKKFEFEEKIFSINTLNHKGSDLQNILISIVFILFILENLFIMISKQAINFNIKKNFKFLFVFLLIPTNLIATEKSIFSLVSSNKIGYVITKNKNINEINENGLISLSNFITQKTAAIMELPEPIDFYTDELYYYPLIYWSIIDENTNLDENEIKKINNYTKNGGLLIIDCKTQLNNILPDDCLKIFRNIFPLNFFSKFKVLNNSHAISKSFYLLNSFPGRRNNKVFVTSNESQKSDKGASIVLSNNHWTDSWALNKDKDFLFPLLDNIENQRTLSFRFGLNLLIHSLTGNYKTDQVHVPEILKRIED